MFNLDIDSKTWNEGTSYFYEEGSLEIEYCWDIYKKWSGIKKIK